ncbi:hypothetical protein Taro_047624 [Colocasia esculenta]|uniref:Uncharacterized protein n=1 Tax=Colocasia esculenta TaxID=4460 RepID=A0A843X7Z3_COLES|nr:hypothetical protein [Colocasia esculenta]
MVATPRDVAIQLLSHWADPSRLGGRRFKTEAAPHSPPLALSLLLLPSSSPLKLPFDSSTVLRALGARVEVVSSRSCRGHARGAWSEEEVFFVLVVLVLRWCRPVRAGDMLVVLGARRRWSFRREGPNGSALLVEVRLLSSDRARVGQRRRGGSCGPRS